MKSKLKFLFQRIPILLTAIATAVILFTPLEARANYDAWAGSIVDSLGSSNSGGTDTVPDGVGYNKTGYLCYMLTPDGAPASKSAVALQSPDYPGDNGATWIVKSRKGNYSVGIWNGKADWDLTPWAEGGSPTHEPQIRQYFESMHSSGVQNAFVFVKDYFGEDMAHKFGNDEAILVIETIMKLSLSVTSGSGNDLTPYQVYINQVNSVKNMSTKQLIEMTGSQDAMDAFLIGNFNDNELRRLVVRLLGEKYRNNPDSFQSSGGKYTVVAGPFVGTVANLVEEKMAYNPEPKVLDSYLLKVAPLAERIQEGKAGQKAGFVPWTGSTSDRLSNQDVLKHGVAMLVISAKNGQTTADEPKIGTVHEAPEESVGDYIIVKNYRTKKGETDYNDYGCTIREKVTSSITIENESPGYKVIEWKITNQFNGKIPSHPWNPPGGVQESGKGPGTVKIKDPYKVLYVLLEKTEEEPPEPEDYNYLISESTITRRIKMSEPDNQLSMPDILNHTFKWVLPAHKTTCSGHTWTKECDSSHTRSVLISNGCPANCTEVHEHKGAEYGTENYNCGQNCKTQTAYCSGWQWKNKNLKLSLHNINQQSSPTILATKTSPKNWFYNPNTNISKLVQGFYRDNNTFDREATSQQIYENKNWDYICVIHRGQDKLNLAEWINNGQGQYDETEATTNLQGVNNEVYQASNKSSGQRKQNGFYTDTFQVSIGRQEHGVEQTDNETIYAPTIPSSVPGQSLLSSSAICPDDQRRATLTPLSFNVIVRVEVYQGDANKGVALTNGLEDGHTSKPRIDGYENVSGRMVEGESVSFIPYILMKYDTIDEAITDAPAYVMGEHSRTLSTFHYGEIAWDKSSNPNLLSYYNYIFIEHCYTERCFFIV